jgi:hypothetical protein
VDPEIKIDEKVKKGVREIYFSCENGEANLSKLICSNNALFLSKKDKEPVSRDIEISCGSIIIHILFTFIQVLKQIKSAHPSTTSPIQSSSRKQARKISIF